MKAVEISVRRPVTVTMASLAVALFGWLALRGLPLELLPDVAYPTLTVRTTWDGAAPAEIETLISRPLEQAVGAIPNIVRVSSVSAPERSDVTVEFDWGTSMEFAALDVREKVDLATLPDDADRPVLLRYDPSLEPVIEAAVSWSGPAAGSGLAASVEARLREIAEDRIARGLEGMAGIAAVTVAGGLEREFQVVLDTDRLSSLGLSVAGVASRLAAENVNQTGGSIEDGDARLLVRTLNEFAEPEDALDVVLASPGGVPIRLGDVAVIERGARDRRVLTRSDGRPAVQVSIYREAEANSVTVADAVRARLQALTLELEGQGLPVAVTIVTDQSRFIRAAIAEVRAAALWGGVLALLVLWVFLRRLGPTLIIALAIPVSLLATFFAMSLSGTTLNVLSLGGLALGIGMLVDSAIVVLEAIEARQQHSPGIAGSADAAVRGASEVGHAVVASTLTTVCVFVPVLFLEGIAAALFRDMAVVVSVALLASLFASLTLIPTLSARAGATVDEAHEDGEGPSTWLALPLRFVRGAVAVVARIVRAVQAPLLALFDRAFGTVESAYPRFLETALRHRLAVVVVTLALAVVAGVLGRGLGGDLLPEMSQGELRVDVRLPVGTPIETTARRLVAVEQALLADADVVSVAATIGRSLSHPGIPAEEREHLASLSVRLRDGVLGPAEDRAADRLRAALTDLAALDARFERPALFSFAAPIEVELRGQSLASLQRAARDVVAALSEIPELRGVSTGARGGNPELQVRFDRERLAALGTGVAAAGEALRDQVMGSVATDLTRGDRDVDLRVQADARVRRDLELLQDLPVVSEGGVPVPLRAVASLSTEQGPAEITRRDQERVAVVTATPRGGDLGSIVPEVQQRLAALELPPGVRAELSGKASELDDSLRGLGLAVGLATFLVYLVMASQFESFLQPLVILFSVPFALVGAVLALRVADVPLSIVAGLGVIMLAGIVVNNAIVLVDRINQRCRDLALHEAIVAAGHDRLRPILMTTSTTVLGLLPLAASRAEGAELRVPLALTVIGGLVLSTLVTLVLIPVLVSWTGAGRAPAGATAVAGDRS